jgi:hypothetical protein
MIYYGRIFIDVIKLFKYKHRFKNHVSMKGNCALVRFICYVMTFVDSK